MNTGHDLDTKSQSTEENLNYRKVLLICLVALEMILLKHVMAVSCMETQQL